TSRARKSMTEKSGSTNANLFAKKIKQEIVDRSPKSGYSTKSNRKKKERRQSRCFIYFLVKQQKIRFQIVLSPEDVRCSRADRS
ncbi:MAG: hypothetical protein NC409_14295, partial [Clostridium sp.]|nr:hypothetical protein [Clostridium sp.]